MYITCSTPSQSVWHAVHSLFHTTSFHRSWCIFCILHQLILCYTFLFHPASYYMPWCTFPFPHCLIHSLFRTISFWIVATAVLIVAATGFINVAGEFIVAREFIDATGGFINGAGDFLLLLVRGGLLLLALKIVFLVHHGSIHMGCDPAPRTW